jgi:hypothetical protein
MKNEVNYDYEAMFKWISSQAKYELELAKEMEKGGSDAFGHGMIVAYESLVRLIENLEKKGYEGYKNECDEIVKKYKEMGL